MPVWICIGIHGGNLRRYSNETFDECFEREISQKKFRKQLQRESWNDSMEKSRKNHWRICWRSLWWWTSELILGVFHLPHFILNLQHLCGIFNRRHHLEIPLEYSQNLRIYERKSTWYSEKNSEKNSGNRKNSGEFPPGNSGRSIWRNPGSNSEVNPEKPSRAISGELREKTQKEVRKKSRENFYRNREKLRKNKPDELLQKPRDLWEKILAEILKKNCRGAPGGNPQGISGEILRY